MFKCDSYMIVAHMLTLRKPSPMNVASSCVAVTIALTFSPFACAQGEAGSHADNDMPWFRRSLVGLEVGPTGSQFGGSPKDKGFAASFNGRDIVQATKACDAEYLVIWAREGDWAYYDSQLQPRPPGLGNRDVLREAVTEGRKLGLPIIAYCQVQYPGHTLREHPEWRMVDHTGNPVDGRVCYRSGYLEYMRDMVEEQLAYGIDGFHLDMVDQGFGAPYGCWCETCQQEFQQEFGHAMPAGVTWDESWDHMLEFRYASSEQFEKQLTAHIGSMNPKATVDYNYHGNPPFSWEVGQRPVQHARNGDFVTGETGSWGFSALTIGLNAEFYQAATPGHPFQIAIQRGVRGYHDQTTRPLNDIRWELLTLLSHGGFVTMVDKTAYDGWLDPVAYERFGEAFKEVHAKRSHFGYQAVYEVGLYFSSRTRDWYGREKPGGYYRAFQGAHKAMAYEHIPWGVIHDENVTLATLQQFPVVMLPNVAILSQDEIDLFRSYVEEGGRLIVTGLTGTYDRLGQPMSNTAISDLIGAKLVRHRKDIDSWVRFPSGDAGFSNADIDTLAPDGRRDWPYLVRGPGVVYEATTAVTCGELLEPHQTWLHVEGRYHPDYPMSADKPIGPAVLVNQVGKGTVLTLSISPDWCTASDHALPEARKLLASAVRLLDSEPRVVIEAPVNVQAVVTDDPASRTLRIHLLAYNVAPQTTPPKNRPYVLPPPIEDTPIYRAKITLDREPKDVTSFSGTTKLEHEGRQITTVVEDIHEVIVVKY